MLALHEGVSEDTLRLRFFTAEPRAGRGATSRTCSTRPTPSRPRWSPWSAAGSPALATAELLSAERAEVAFLVVRRGPRPRPGQPAARAPRGAGPRARRDPLRGRGARATTTGCSACSAAAGFAVSRRTADGEVSVELRTEVSRRRPRRRRPARVALRGPLAAAAAAPASVAVVGVRRDGGGLGRPCSTRSGRAGFAGRLHVVHPGGRRGGRRAGVPSAWPRSPDAVDLVVVVVPGRPGARRDGRRRARRARGGDRRVVGLRRTGGPRRPRPRTARAGPRPQRAAWSARTRRACSPHGADGAPQRDLRPGVAGAGRAGRRLPVGRRRASPCSTWPAARASACTRSSRSAPSSTCPATTCWPRGWTTTRCGGGAVPRVVRQRAQVRADRPPLRRAQAAAAVVGGRSLDRLRRVGVDALFAQAGVIPCRGAADMAETAARADPAAAARRATGSACVTNAGGMGVLAAGPGRRRGALGADAVSASCRAGCARPCRSVGAGNPVDLGADVRRRRSRPPSRLLLDSGEVDALVVDAGADQPGRPGGAPCARPSRPRVGSRTSRCWSSPPTPPRRARCPGVTVYRTPLVGGRRAGAGDEVRRVAAGAGRRPPAPTGRPAAVARAWATGRLAARGGTRVAAGVGERRAAGAVRRRARRRRGHGPGRRGRRRGGDRLAGRGQGGRPDGPAQDRPRAGAGRAARRRRRSRGGRGLRAELRPRRGRGPGAAGRRRRRGRRRRGARRGVRPPGAGRRGRRRQRAAATTRSTCSPPVAPSDAARALRGLRIWPLLDGVRGSERVDVDALEALVVGRRPARGRRTPGRRPRPQPAGRRPRRRALRRREGAAAAADGARRRASHVACAPDTRVQPGPDDGRGPGGRSRTPRWSGPRGPPRRQGPGTTTVGPGVGPALRDGSTSIRAGRGPTSAAARSSGLCWPTPAVKTTASTRAEDGVVGADVLADPVAVDVEGQRGGRVTRGAEAITSRKSLCPASPFSPESRLRARSMSRATSPASGAGARAPRGRGRRTGCPSPGPREA